MSDVCTGGKEAKTRQLDDIEEHPQMALFRRYHIMFEWAPRLVNVACFAFFWGLMLIVMAILRYQIIVHDLGTARELFYYPDSSCPFLIVILVAATGIEALAASAGCLLLSCYFCQKAISIQDKLRKDGTLATKLDDG